MIMLVNKDRYPLFAKLNKWGRDITDEDLDSIGLGLSYFYAFMRARGVLKEGCKEPDMQSI